MKVDPKLTAYEEGYKEGKEKGYSIGMNDALKVITNLLQHNDIKLNPVEFYKEYSNMLKEGTLKVIKNGK